MFIFIPASVVFAAKVAGAGVLFGGASTAASMGVKKFRKWLKRKKRDK